MSPTHGIAFRVFDTGAEEWLKEHDGLDDKDVTDFYWDHNSQRMGPRIDSNPILRFAVTL